MTTKKPKVRSLLTTLFDILPQAFRWNKKDNKAGDCSSFKGIIGLLVAAINPVRIFVMRSPTIQNNNEVFTNLILVLPANNPYRFDELEPVIDFACFAGKNVSCYLFQEHHLQSLISKDHIYYSLTCRRENEVYRSVHAARLSFPTPNLQSLQAEALKALEFYQPCIAGFYQSALFHYNRTNYSLTVFMVHQTIELSLRALLKVYGLINKRTHSIRSLKRLCLPFFPQFTALFSNDTNEEERFVSLLDEAYSDARYNLNHSISQEDAWLLLTKADLLERVMISI